MPAKNLFYKFWRKFQFDWQSIHGFSGYNSLDNILFYSFVGYESHINEKLFRLLIEYLIRSEESVNDDLKTNILDNLNISDIDPNEPGLYVWSQPIITVINGKRVGIFVLNCQLSLIFQESAILLAMASVLSSSMIINVNQMITEDILIFVRHCVSFAKSELKDDNQLNRLIFFVQNWSTDVYEDNQWFKPYLNSKYYGDICGLHDDNSPSDEEFNYKIEFLSPQKKQTTAERFVRQSLGKTFKEIVVCLLASDVTSDLSEVDSKIVTDLLKRITDTENISDIMTVEQVVKQMSALNKYELRDDMTADQIRNDFSVKMVINFAADYFNYNMDSIQMTTDYCRLRLKLKKQSIKLFKSFKYFEGQLITIDKKSKHSLLKLLNKYEKYFDQKYNYIDVKSKGFRTVFPTLADINEKLNNFEKLSQQFDDFKSENSQKRRDLENQLKILELDLRVVAEEVDDLKVFLKKKSDEDQTANMVDTISTIVGDAVPSTKIWLKLAKFAYKTTKL